MNRVAVSDGGIYYGGIFIQNCYLLLTDNIYIVHTCVNFVKLYIENSIKR